MHPANPFSTFQQDLPVDTQADTSTPGLEACLIHNSKPITFTSKSLVETETRYVKTECEFLTEVYACDYFHT